MSLISMLKDSVTIVRGAARTPVKASMQDRKAYFTIDVDIEEGDLVEHSLRTGKTRVYEVTHVIHYENPPHMAHIKAELQLSRSPGSPATQAGTPRVQTNNFFGSGNNVNVAGHDATLNHYGDVNVIPGNRDSLLRALEAAGVAQDKRDELTAILDQDTPANDMSTQEKVTMWANALGTLGQFALALWSAFNGAPDPLPPVTLA